MTRADWQTLERLCHAAINENSEAARHPAIGDAIRTTGAFAAAVADNLARSEEQRC